MKFKYLIFLSMLLCLVSVSSKLRAELVAYWPMDRIVEGKVLDASGNACDGTIVGKLQVTQVANHKGLYFDGGANYIDCGSDRFDKICDQISISAWIKIGKFDKWIQTIVSKDGDIWQLQRGWGDSPRSINFNLKAGNGGTIRASGVMGMADIDDDNWHHIAAVYDGRNMILYIDGKLNNSLSVGQNKLSSEKNKLTIGENLLNGKSKEDAKYSRSWHGCISQVAIFDNALTSSQVGLLYNTDPLICRKYLGFSDIISRSDIDLLKKVQPEVFESFLTCKQLACQRKYPAAIQALDELISNNIDLEQSLVNNAFFLKYHIYIQQDDIENAIRTIETLQKTYPEPNCGEATFLLAYCYIKQGDNIKAQALLKEIIEKYPQSTSALKAKLSLSRIEMSPAL